MTDKIYNIGVMIGNVYTSHPQELIHGIGVAAEDKNVNLVFFLGTQSNAFYRNLGSNDQIRDFDYQFNSIYDFSLYGDLDALIISYGTLCIFLNENNRETFLERYSHIPRVILEDRIQDKNATYIISDNYDGMKRIINHLIEDHNYKKILFVSGPEGNTDATERRNAYLDSMSDHGIVVTDEMMIYGDYSEFIENEIVNLIKANPGVEAIACANDGMALSAYKACAMLGLQVGKDIAITGYDNVDKAPMVDPPLTTVDQNGYDMGYHALLEAINICENRKSAPLKLPVKFYKRGSCGCVSADKNDDLFEYISVDEITNWLTSKVLLNDTKYVKSEIAYSYLEKIVDYLINDVGKEESFCCEHEEKIKDYIRLSKDSEAGSVISAQDLTEGIGTIIFELIGQCDDKVIRNRYIKLLNSIHIYMSATYRVQQDALIVDMSRKNWMGPLYVRQMVSMGLDEQKVFSEAVKGLKRQGIKSSYIYVYEEPIDYKKGDKWHVPEKMYLVAYHNSVGEKTYAENERPIITTENGISAHMENHKSMYVAFALFFEDLQYGVALCEIGASEISSTYVMSLELATGIHYMRIAQKERQAAKQLEIALAEIRDKNTLLEFVSMKDPLTGLYNRRGLAEEVIKHSREHIGQRGFIVFADLDHLKQINDTFGHGEGDYAITSIANVISEVSGDKAVVSRIGGDEFVAFIFPGWETDELEIANQIRKKCDEHNAISDKPYYIECSTGVMGFKCEENINIASLLDMADDVLYVSKQKRRQNVIK